MGWSGWYGDTSTASMIVPILSCGGRAAGTNQSRFCDRTIDARIERARATELSDPAASARQWAAIDRRLVDAAAVLPLFVPARVTTISRRLSGLQFHPRLGPLLAQASVACPSGRRC